MGKLQGDLDGHIVFAVNISFIALSVIGSFEEEFCMVSI